MVSRFARRFEPIGLARAQRTEGLEPKRIEERKRRMGGEKAVKGTSALHFFLAG